MEYNITYRDKDGGIQVIISYKDPTGRWKQKSKQGFKKKKEAKSYADTMIDELKKNIELSNKLDAEYTGMTFHDFSAMYLKSKSLYCEQNTITHYQNSINAFEDILDIPMHEIKSIHIQDAVNNLMQKKYNPKSIKAYIVVLKSFFQAAINPYRIILENPLAYDSILLPKVKEDTKIRALTKMELNKLLSDFNNEKDQRDYLISLIAATSGLRIGEILGLCESDVDFENFLLKITKQWKKLKTGEYGFGDPKTKNSIREVPVPASTMKEIRRYIENQKVKDMHKRIFWKDTSTMVTTSRLITKYKRKGYDISIHDLRHTYATMLIANGVDFKTISSLLGNTVEMVMRTYSHTTDDMLKHAKNTIEMIF